jgi:RNA polymerase sigma-B factor
MPTSRAGRPCHAAPQPHAQHVQHAQPDLDVEVHPSAQEAWPAVDPLLQRLSGLGRHDPQRGRLRDQIICRCAPAARREAARYRRTGEAQEDLVQVALLGLVLAVDRYDPARGIPFKHFAVPTIAGELKRHFRDKCWSVRVGRRVQELYQEVRKAEPELAQRLGRTPTTRDLADALAISEEDVLAARAGEAAYATRSLNWPAFGDADSCELHELIGGPDRDLEKLPDHDALRRAWQLLPERLRVILSLRFDDDLSQTQIADKLGISQMHVSRLINRSLTLLRKHMMID